MEENLCKKNVNKWNGIDFTSMSKNRLIFN